MYDSTSGDDGLFVPLVLDTNPLAGSSPMPAKSREFAAGASVLPLPADVRLPQAKDYFARKPVSTGRDLVQETLQETSRSSSTERKQPPSPHIAYQEKSWQPSDHLGDTTRRKKETANDSSPAPSRSNEANANSPSYPSAPSSQTDFKLQDVPKSKRAGSHRSSQSKSSTTGSPVVDGTFHTPLRDVPRSSSPQHMDNLKMQEDDPGAYQPPQTESAPRPSAERPKRGDSLQNSMKQALTRKDTPSMQDSGSTTPNASTGFVENESTPSVSTQANEPTGPQVNGKSISSPIESPTSRSILDVPNAPPARSLSRPSPTGVPLESFTSPRAAPPPPPTPSGRHGTSESVSTIQTEGSNKLSPMNLPRYSTGAEFSMDEDMARILRGEDTSQPEPGVLRKMSNVVRHGRSFSDRGARTVSGSGKWSAKSPRNGSMDISSPISATSPDAREENILLKGQLRRSQQRIAELENEKNGLQSIVNKSADINHVNSEIREKRSTMAFLDSQREIVVRELEILTDHVKRAKDSNKPVDINTLKSDISKDLGASLQRLKDSFAPQIEELIQKRNDLTNEIADLIQMKDKGFQEYESLSTRNAQLIQHNNELIHQIQDFYKANRQPNGQSFDAGRSLANGLGIQLPNKERSETSSDLRTLAGTEGSLSNLTGDNETESIVSTPQVVNIRKQAKANMWKKGTQGLTKGLRGVRGALVSEKSSSQYQLEAMPYNHMSGDALVQKPNEPMRRNFGNFFSGEKQGSKLQQLKLSHSNNSNPSLLSDVTASVANLFGSDLTARCDLEKRVIPSIVTRCVEEVELRGMDVEGIYRKSGGSGQVNQVRVGFEQSNEHDISDPDLDIHAVTSALKQYFRRLPIPLITFDVYDSLLEATRVEDETKKAQKMKDAINTLPRCHRDSLEFLVFHLGRVMAKADVNLVCTRFHRLSIYRRLLTDTLFFQMTPLNLAVVFAPTIMRPQSIEREMSDMQTQRNAVQSMLEHSKIIFSDN